MSNREPQEYLYVKAETKKILQNFSKKLGIPIVKIVEVVFRKMTLQDCRKYYDEDLDSDARK